jgi:hypothetical protein
VPRIADRACSDPHAKPVPEELELGQGDRERALQRVCLREVLWGDRMRIESRYSLKCCPSCRKGAKGIVLIHNSPTDPLKV